MSEYRPNYSDRRRKKVKTVDKKRFIVAVLLTASIGLSTGYGVYKGGETVINNISDKIYYEHESKPYFEMVNRSFRTNPESFKQYISMNQLAHDFLQLEFENKDDVYHSLIECARFMRYNLDENFNDLLDYLDLDTLAKNNKVFPSKNEVYAFLNNKGFIKEDGKINFDEWRDYDKDVFNMERELDNLKEGKSK